MTRAEQALANLKDDRLREIFQRIWKGMKHEEALRKAERCRSNIERTANNG